MYPDFSGKQDVLHRMLTLISGLPVFWNSDWEKYFTQFNPQKKPVNYNRNLLALRVVKDRPERFMNSLYTFF